MAQLTSHGQSASSRRPHSLSPEDVEALKREDKHYGHLGSQLVGVPRQSAKYREIQSRRRAHLDRICKIRLKEIREKWSDEQGVEDIARHVRGEQFAPVDPGSGRPRRRLQQRALDLLKAPLTNQYTTELERRTTAIRGLMDYCGDDDPVVPKAVKAPGVIASSGSAAEEDIVEEMKKSVFVETAGKKGVLRCFVCVARAEQLGAEHDSFSGLCRTFARAGTLARHFISTHLDALPVDAMFVCPMCQKTLIHKKHVQNHSDKVHGICTDIVFRRPVKKRN